MAAHSGFTRVARPSLTVQATPDYSDGDCVGGLITLDRFARTSPQGDGVGGSGILTRLTLRSLIDISVPVIFHLFDANPSASTFTDNSAMTIHANDRSKLLKSIEMAAADLADPHGAESMYVAELLGPGGVFDGYLPYELPSGRDLYLAIEADGTINFSSAADWSLIVAAEQN